MYPLKKICGYKNLGIRVDGASVMLKYHQNIRSDEGLALETSAPLSLHGGNLTLIDCLIPNFSVLL